MEQLQSGQLVRIIQLKKITNLSKSSIYRLMNEGRFPKQVKLGERIVAWRTDDIIAWLNGLQEVK